MHTNTHVKTKKKNITVLNDDRGTELGSAVRARWNEKKKKKKAKRTALWDSGATNYPLLQSNCV